LNQNEQLSTLFEKQADIIPVNGLFSLALQLDSLYTITTTTGQKKGSYPVTNPACSSFPIPYKDSFDTYSLESEARYFADQTGTFSIASSSISNSKVMRQVVKQSPIRWCDESQSPISLVGSNNLQYVEISVDFLIEESGGSAIVGGRAPQGGCGNSYSKGYYLTITADGHWNFSAGTSTLASGSSLDIKINEFHKMTLTLGKDELSGKYDDKVLFSVKDTKFANGFVALGSSWNYVQFDNFSITAAS